MGQFAPLDPKGFSHKASPGPKGLGNEAVLPKGLRKTLSEHIFFIMKLFPAQILNEDHNDDLMILVGRENSHRCDVIPW